jgi:sugar/nucleoside kinase (ribokinase family)
MFMLDKDMYHSLKSKAGKDDIIRYVDIDVLPKLGDMLIEMGVRIAVIKCGSLGLYVKTAGNDAVRGIGKAAPKNVELWAVTEYFSGVYRVDNIKSALGAGDTSIAGLLAALLRGADLETAVNAACSAGALCVQTYGATGGILPFEKMQSMFADKKKVMPEYNGTYWKPDKGSAMLVPSLKKLTLCPLKSRQRDISS